MFERAIELDSGYAAAYAFLSRTCITEWAMIWNRDPQTLERAFALGQKSVALDGSLPLAHLALGFTYLWKKQHEQAIAEAEKAIAFNPNDAESYAALGDILNYAGRPAEAIALVEKAMHLDPHYPVAYLFNLGRAYWLLRRYEEAITILKRTLIRNPTHLSTHGYLLMAYSELDQQAEAQAEWAEVLRSNPDFSREVLLEAIRQNFPYQAPAVTERMLAALRKAELK